MMQKLSEITQVLLDVRGRRLDRYALLCPEERLAAALAAKLTACPACRGKGRLQRSGNDGDNWRWCPRCFGYGVRVDELLELLGLAKREDP
jgi:hypothetical protein